MKWYFILLIIFLVFLLFVGVIKSRWKKKHNGESIKTKEIWKKFWKGVDGITPKQIAVSQMMGSWILITGFIFGIVTALYLVFGWKAEGAIGFIVSRPVWFLIVISASFLISILSLIGSWQKYRRIKLIENQIKEIEIKNRKEKSEEELQEEINSQDKEVVLENSPSNNFHHQATSPDKNKFRLRNIK